jgi:hypothetical protein
LWASRFNAGFRSNLYHASTDDSYLSEFEPFSHNEAHSDGVVVVGLHPDTEFAQLLYGASTLYPVAAPVVVESAVAGVAARAAAARATTWVMDPRYGFSKGFVYGVVERLSPTGLPDIEPNPQFVRGRAWGNIVGDVINAALESFKP